MRKVSFPLNSSQTFLFTVRESTTALCFIRALLPDDFIDDSDKSCSECENTRTLENWKLVVSTSFIKSIRTYMLLILQIIGTFLLYVNLSRTIIPISYQYVFSFDIRRRFYHLSFYYDVSWIRLSRIRVNYRATRCSSSNGDDNDNWINISLQTIGVITFGTDTLYLSRILIAVSINMLQVDAVSFLGNVR